MPHLDGNTMSLEKVKKKISYVDKMTNPKFLVFIRNLQKLPLDTLGLQNFFCFTASINKRGLCTHADAVDFFSKNQSLCDIYSRFYRRHPFVKFNLSEIPPRLKKLLEEEKNHVRQKQQRQEASRTHGYETDGRNLYRQSVATTISKPRPWELRYERSLK